MASPWRGAYLTMRRLWYSSSVVCEVTLLTCLWMTMYIWSLKGGDLEEIKKMMARLGAYLLISIGIASYNLWRIMLTPTRSRWKRIEIDTNRGSPLQRVWSRLLRSRSSMVPLDTESPRGNSEGSEGKQDTRIGYRHDSDNHGHRHDNRRYENEGILHWSRDASYNDLEYYDESLSVIQQSPLPRGGIGSGSKVNADEPRRLYRFRSEGGFEMDSHVWSYTKTRRNGLLLLNLCALLLLAVYDRGVDFQRHGSFNMLIFLILFVPINVIVGSVILWYKSMSRRHFIQSFATVITVFLLVVGLRLQIMKQRNQYGFFGERMLRNEDLCDIPIAAPYFDVLPKRAQTFWTGRTGCPAVPSPRMHRGGFFSKIDFDIHLTNDGWLNITCPGGIAEFTFTPDTRYWSKEEKLSQPLGNTLQDNIVKFLADNRQPYLPGDDPRGMYVGGLARGALSDESNLTPDTVIGYCNGVGRMATAIPDRPDMDAKLRFWEAYRQKSGSQTRPGDELQLPPNIMILFIDGVGRKQFFRRLPLTAAALESVHGSAAWDPSDSSVDMPQSNLYHFFRYHSVGFNTGPNTQALFTGIERRYDRYYAPIWNVLKNRGQYVTAVVQGHCEDWNVLYQEHLNERKVGNATVVTPDVDYELESMACFPEYEPVKWTDRGNFQGYTSIVPRCLWGRHVHQWELDYSRKFIQKFNGKAPWFLATTLMEGHEGTGEVLSQIDESLSSFLMHDVPRDNTVLLLVSDHGLHMGLNFLYFLDGKVNHRTPFGAMTISRNVLSKVAEKEQTLAGNLHRTLVENQQRLLTAADMYFTLRHIAQQGFDWSSVNNPTDNKTVIGWTSEHFNLHSDPDIHIPRRNQQTLLKPIPTNRTCATAGIPNETCICS